MSVRPLLLLPCLPSVFGISAALTAILWVAVRQGWASSLDNRLLRAWPLRETMTSGDKPTKLVTAARDLIALGGDCLRLMFLLICVVELVAGGRAKDAAVLTAIYAVSRLALFIVKARFPRPRPNLGLHGVVTYTSSFPSGHTFLTVVLALSAAMIIPDHRATAALLYTGIACALVIGMVIGMTRISFGVHWPSDVLAGWLAAIAWVSGCLLLI